MNLKGQHIGRLFTFLAGLIILAHTVVPHHHHFEITHSSQQESTRESSSQEKNTENPDFHCHAFNLLVSEKTSPSSLNQSFSKKFNLYTAGIIGIIEFPPLKNLTATFPGHQAVFLKRFLFTDHTLRGPPVLF